MQQYNVTGMSCAACSTRVEKTVSKVSGVTGCSVNLLTNSMMVDGNASTESIIQAVESAGYGASLKDGKNQIKKDEKSLDNKEIHKIKIRLLCSVGFLIVLMYFSMGHMMWGFPLPAWFDGNHVAMGLVQLLLSSIIMVINQKFFINGFKSLFNHAPNMDTLVALGSSAAFIWSVAALFMMTDAQVHGSSEQAMQYMDEFYFESAAMILTLITIGKMLEARSKGKTTDALKGLMNLSPKTAVLLRDEAEVTVPIEQVKKGDIFIVRPGDSVPVDGIITDGSCAIDESALTGESIPVDKNIGDSVSAATINKSGFIKCEALRVGEDTTISQIIKMVSDASATKAPIAKIADKVSGIFVPTVICISVLTIIIWLLLGREFSFALARGISVLVISCPCALGLATPVAIMVGSGVGAKNGILFKTAVSLENMGKSSVVALDKTGTITKGQPVVTDIIAEKGVSDEELLSTAFALEIKSEHPLANAVVDYCKMKNMRPHGTENFRILPGNGLMASVNNIELTGGSVKFISSKTGISSYMQNNADKLAKDGKTPLMFTKNNKSLGIIAVADTIKEDSVNAITELRNMGIKVVMLTGDNERTANAIGKNVGVDEVIAGVLPDGKESVIKGLKKYGKVIMVGDGINDAPALTSADTGVAIGAGTDIAIDAADVVLMKSSLYDVPAAIRLSRAALRNIHENLFWAFIYNIIGIPLAAGVFVKLGLTLNPMFGAAAMSLSSFCVVSNALRLNLVKIYNDKHDRKVKKMENKEILTKTLHIEGMMCGHCEKRVKNVLEEISTVETAQVSHEKGTAIVTLSKETSNDILKSTVEAQDYTVTRID